MKYITTLQTGANHRCLWEISDEERAKYTDKQLINMADARGDESRADTCHHFGGFVEKVGPQQYQITVYTD